MTMTPASLARWIAGSIPASSTAEITMRLTPCWMRASIWVFWLARSSWASCVLRVAPILAAASLAPLSIAEKNGLDMSWTIRPIFSILVGVAAAAGTAQARARAASAATLVTERKRGVVLLLMASFFQLLRMPVRVGDATGERHRRPRLYGAAPSPCQGAEAPPKDRFPRGWVARGRKAPCGLAQTEHTLWPGPTRSVGVVPQARAGVPSVRVAPLAERHLDRRGRIIVGPRLACCDGPAAAGSADDEPGRNLLLMPGQVDRSLRTPAPLGSRLAFDDLG